MFDANIAIIGTGSIAGLIDTKHSPNIASHAHAIDVLDGANLKAVVEPDEENAKEFFNRWSHLGDFTLFKDAKEMLTDETIDTVIIASPTRFHAHALNLALQAPHIKNILCEKPLVEDLDELNLLAPKLITSEKKILINLMRQYDPSHIELANIIKQKIYGNTLAFDGVFTTSAANQRQIYDDTPVNSRFTKELFHNGIHMFTMLSSFFGRIKNINPIGENDFLVGHDGIEGAITCIKEATYSIFELTIYLEKGKIEIRENGREIRVFEQKPSEDYENYNMLHYVYKLPDTLQYYAKNSLEFLLKSSHSTCNSILEKHITMHKRILENIEKEAHETSN